MSVWLWFCLLEGGWGWEACNHYLSWHWLVTSHMGTPSPQTCSNLFTLGRRWLEKMKFLVTARKRNLWRWCFYSCLSKHALSRGCASQHALGRGCLPGGVCLGGVSARGCVFPEGCVCGRPEADTPSPSGYYGIRSTSGWYESHWNAFLFTIKSM